MEASCDIRGQSKEMFADFFSPALAEVRLDERPLEGRRRHEVRGRVRGHLSHGGLLCRSPLGWNRSGIYWATLPGHSFFNGLTPASFSSSFLSTVQKLVVSWIRTWIIKVEGEDADHSTTTTALPGHSLVDLAGIDNKRVGYNS